MIYDIINFIKSLSIKVKLLILLLFTIIFIAAPLFILGSNKQDIDSDPWQEGLIELDYSKGVNLVNSGILVKQIGNGIRYTNIREDLYYFADQRYDVYKNDVKKIIGFKIESKKLEVKDNVITFYGKYGSVKNKIKVTFTKLNNDQIKISITDTKDNFNMDDKLPSNNKKQQFIGSLPYIVPDYSISYSYKENKITVKLAALELKNNALEYLKSKLDQTNINDSEVMILYPLKNNDTPKSEYRQTLISEK